MQKVQGADKINKFNSLEGDATNTLQKNASTKRYYKTLSPSTNTKRYHKTLPLMGATRLASGHFSAASSRVRY